MRRLSKFHYEPFDWPDEISVRDWGRNEDRWAVVVDGDQTEMEAAMEMLRKVANRAYKLPRPLRFKSPGMYVIGVCDGWDQKLADWVKRQPTSTWLGGEVFYMILVCSETGRVAHHESYGTVDRMREAMFDPGGLARRLLGEA